MRADVAHRARQREPHGLEEPLALAPLALAERLHPALERVAERLGVAGVVRRGRQLARRVRVADRARERGEVVAEDRVGLAAVGRLAQRYASARAAARGRASGSSSIDSAAMASIAATSGADGASPKPPSATSASRSSARAPRRASRGGAGR